LEEVVGHNPVLGNLGGRCESFLPVCVLEDLRENVNHGFKPFWVEYFAVSRRLGWARGGLQGVERKLRASWACRARAVVQDAGIGCMDGLKDRCGCTLFRLS
jgi:hypothetical protein